MGLGKVVRWGTPGSSGPKIDHFANRFAPQTYSGEVANYAMERRQFQTISSLMDTNVSHFPNFQLTDKYRCGGPPSRQTRCCQGGKDISRMYIYGPNRLMQWSVSATGLPGDPPLYALPRIHSGKSSIWRSDFPNPQLSEKYPFRRPPTLADQLPNCTFRISTRRNPMSSGALVSRGAYIVWM